MDPPLSAFPVCVESTLDKASKKADPDIQGREVPSYYNRRRMFPLAYNYRMYGLLDVCVQCVCVFADVKRNCNPNLPDII